MAPRDVAFEEWVREHFAALGPLEIKRMFGGAGVYHRGLIFALLDDGVVWLKADDDLATRLEAEGSRPFTYPAKDGASMSLGYWSLPEIALDDSDEAVAWARRAIDVSVRKAAAKPVRKSKATSQREI